MKLKALLMVGAFSAIGFTSCKDDRRAVEQDQMELEEISDGEVLRRDNTVVSRIDQNERLSTFSENMNRNQISRNFEPSTTTSQGQTSTTGQGQTGTTAENKRSYTVFAPSNDAYNRLTDAQRSEMTDTANRDRTTASLNYLIVEQKLTEDQLRQQIQNSNGSYVITTMQGENLTASLDGDQIILKDGAGNQAKITETDSEASDGVVYTIDRVLMPQDPTRNAAAIRAQNTTGSNPGTTNPGASNTGTDNSTERNPSGTNTPGTTSGSNLETTKQ